MGFLAICAGVLYFVAIAAGELFGRDAMIPAVFLVIAIPGVILQIRDALK